eukprot:gnl/MRDRNA2_/MRDRNA2_80207_c0_seq1.p1 gnl/MRDRNA2_/MRDRNA2_80207_c0~~gnl/MRDRNA2_/MRDRNA2_80207_c0_seq1.p1  ORF type:complete len:678 (+),score=98.11 gnl/MRDRNA2_/MRDRNA2_80207_c0_seq1:194-2035(+)
MYPLQKTNSVVMVGDPQLIVNNYLRGWFIVDFLSIIPFDLLGLVLHASDLSTLRLLRIIRLLRLLKLIRLLKGMRLFQRWQLEMGISYRSLTLWQLVFAAGVTTHWMACVLGLASNLQGTSCADLGNDDECLVTWATTAHRQILFADFNNPDIGDVSSVREEESYAISLWVAATIIVHPHAMLPTGAGECIMFVVMLFWGGFVWTQIISRSTSIATSMSRHKIYDQQTMDDLNMIAARLHLSHHLKRRLRGFFINTKDWNQRITWKDLSRRMSPQLQSDVAREVNITWVLKVSYLSAVSWDLIAEIAQNLELNLYAQRETFGVQYTIHILSKGIASRCLNFKVLQPGDVWGEEDLLFTCWWLLEDVTSVALTFAEVLTLERQKFVDACANHPRDQPKIRQCYVRRAVQKGILFEARLRIREQNKLSQSKRISVRQAIEQTLKEFGSEQNAEKFEETRALRHRHANLHKLEFALSETQSPQLSRRPSLAPPSCSEAGEPNSTGRQPQQAGTDGRESKVLLRISELSQEIGKVSAGHLELSQRHASLEAEVKALHSKMDYHFEGVTKQLMLMQHSMVGMQNGNCNGRPHSPSKSQTALKSMRQPLAPAMPPEPPP